MKRSFEETIIAGMAQIVKEIQFLNGTVKEVNNQKIHLLNLFLEEYKADLLDRKDFRAKSLDYQKQLVNGSAVIQSEVIRIRNGLKDGKFSI